MIRTPQVPKFHEAQNVSGFKPRESLQRDTAATHMHPEEIGVEGEPFGGAATPWPLRYSHPPLFSSVLGGDAQLVPPLTFPRTSQGPFSTKQHNSLPPPQHPHRPDPGLRPVRHQALRTRERASRTRFPADTPASVPDSPIAPLEYGPRSNLGLCGPAWALPLPLPSLPKGQEGQDGARGLSRVNRLGAAGVWSSRDRTHRNVHSQ